MFFHELGHFIFAKRSGILVREFAIGFGPKLFSYKKGETNYTIRLLPIGGYVRMAGEDPEMTEIKLGHRVGIVLDQNEIVTKIILSGRDKYKNVRTIEVEKADLEHQLFIRGYEDGEETISTYNVSREAMIVENHMETQIAPYDRQFNSKKLSQRAMTIFAGPLFNFILAILVFTFISVIQGVPVKEPLLGKVIPDGPAHEAGFQEGDLVLSIDGTEVNTFSEMTQIVRAHPEEELVFTIERNNETLDIAVIPEKHLTENGDAYGLIGVHASLDRSIGKIAISGIQETFYWTIEIFRLLGQLLTGQFSIDMLSGPVGIYASTETVAKAGVLYLLQWTALLSINLGIMNLLPIPALDGGRLLFFGIEAIRGKPIDRQKEGIVHFIGFALLMLLMIVVTWNDIQRFFIN